MQTQRIHFPRPCNSLNLSFMFLFVCVCARFFSHLKELLECIELDEMYKITKQITDKNKYKDYIDYYAQRQPKF